MSDSDVFSFPEEHPDQADGGDAFDFLPAADSPETSVSEASAYRKERSNKAVLAGVGIAIWILLKLLRASS